jgi:hypothetical protein
MPELTFDQIDAITDIAWHFSNLLRASLRALATDDPAPHFFEMMDALRPMVEMLAGVPSSFDYYYTIFEMALEDFENPKGLDELDHKRLIVARSGMELLARQTHNSERKTAGYEALLADQLQRFDRLIEAFQNSRKTPPEAGTPPPMTGPDQKPAKK